MLVFISLFVCVALFLLWFCVVLVGVLAADFIRVSFMFNHYYIPSPAFCLENTPLLSIDFSLLSVYSNHCVAALQSESRIVMVFRTHHSLTLYCLLKWGAKHWCRLQYTFSTFSSMLH